MGGYLSTTLLLLAGLGVLAPGRRGLKLVLLGWLLLVLAHMYGQPPLLGHVIGVLPDMSKMKFYRYGTAVARAAGHRACRRRARRLIRGPANRRRLLGGALAALAVVIAAVLGARSAVHSLGTGSIMERTRPLSGLC